MPGEQRAPRFEDLDGGGPELAVREGLQATAEVAREELHAVTDAQNGHAGTQDLGIEPGGSDLQRALGTTGQDERGRAARRDLRPRRIVGKDLAKDVGLAHATRDQPRVLRSEIEDDDSRRRRTESMGHAAGLAIQRRASA